MISCVSLTMVFGVWALLGPVSLNCTNAPNNLKQVKLDLQMAFTSK